MYIVYTRKHIVKSVDSVYRTACEIDRMVDPGLKISSQLPILEWVAGTGFMPDWRVHWKQFKNLFSSEIPEESRRVGTVQQIVLFAGTVFPLAFSAAAAMKSD